MRIHLVITDNYIDLLMEKYLIKSFLTIIVCAISLCVNAQSACDKLFASGVKLQQTMSISSQRKAITFFEKAKACYDSQARKDLCDQQIKACRNIIVQLQPKEDQQQETEKVSQDQQSKLDTDTVRVVVEPERKVALYVDHTYLKFNGKGGEFKKAKVTCNYPDWKITEKPSWVNCSRNENDEIVIEVEKNPSNKEERSGIVKIECDDKSVTLTVIQEKYKKFLVL